MGIAADRLNWIIAHKNYDGPSCLLYPYDTNTSIQQYISYGGRWTWAPRRLMCTLAHGEPPPGARFAMNTCDGYAEGCLNPRHLKWTDGIERHAIVKERHDNEW